MHAICDRTCSFKHIANIIRRISRLSRWSRPEVVPVLMRIQSSPRLRKTRNRFCEESLHAVELHHDPTRQRLQLRGSLQESRSPVQSRLHQRPLLRVLLDRGTCQAHQLPKSRRHFEQKLRHRRVCIWESEQKHTLDSQPGQYEGCNHKMAKGKVEIKL